MERLTRLSLTHPKLTLAVIALITLFLGAGAPKVKPEFGYRAAIRGAVLHCGRAVVTSSLALALGFLTLMGSAWQSISSFGLFIALAIISALVATLFVLPALMVAFSPELADDSRGRAFQSAPGGG